MSMISKPLRAHRRAWTLLPPDVSKCERVRGYLVLNAVNESVVYVYV